MSRTLDFGTVSHRSGQVVQEAQHSAMMLMLDAFGREQERF